MSGDHNMYCSANGKQEPVAWMEYIHDEEWEVWFVEPTNLPEGHTYKPLYTKPQYRELSDEEIEEIASQYLTAHAQFIGAGEVTYDGEIDFARAILKKASEK